MDEKIVQRGFLGRSSVEVQTATNFFMGWGFSEFHHVSMKGLGASLCEKKKATRFYGGNDFQEDIHKISIE